MFRQKFFVSLNMKVISDSILYLAVSFTHKYGAELILRDRRHEDISFEFSIYASKDRKLAEIGIVLQALLNDPLTANNKYFTYVVKICAMSKCLFNRCKTESLRCIYMLLVVLRLILRVR